VESILHYQQYREYLRDYYEEQKKKKTGFTYAKFAATAGLGSPNYFKLVMDGQKNLTSENIIRFARALGFNEIESDYFEALVQYNQARRALERDFYDERLKRLRTRATHPGYRNLEQDEFEAISHWLASALLVLTHVPGFRESPAWIRERLYNQFTETEIADVLERLCVLGLLARDEAGKLKPTTKTVQTKPELRQVASKLFYESIFKRALQAVSLNTGDEREFGACIVGLSPAQIPELKRRVREFIQQLNSWALENPKPLQVYALNFSGFPLTIAERRHFQ